MTVTSVDKNPEALTLTITSEYPATAAQVWSLWADGDTLGKWWGPPGYPATFTSFDLRVGGEFRYHMTSPEGETFPGWFEVLSLDEGRSLSFVEGFADAEGNRLSEPPGSTMTVSIVEGEGTTSMSIHVQYESAAAMEQLLAMGMDEGMREALTQTDALVAAA